MDELLGIGTEAGLQCIGYADDMWLQKENLRTSPINPDCQLIQGKPHLYLLEEKER